MTERIASGEIHIEVDDDQARRDLQRLDAQYDRTMRSIDGKQAVVDIKGDIKPLKRDLDRATAAVAAQQKKVDAIQNAGARKNAEKKLTALKKEQSAARGLLTQERARLEAQREHNTQLGINIQRTQALERRERTAFRAFEQSQRRKQQALQREVSTRERLDRQRAREFNTAHSMALREDRDRLQAITSTERQERAVARLQKQYAAAAEKVDRLGRAQRKVRTLLSPIAAQRVKIDQAHAVAEMNLLRAELAAMGKVPVKQEIDLHVDENGVNTLNRWIKAVTETAVRIGPFTTTIAGLARTMLVLGPIVSGLVGQFAALLAVVGAGAVGGLGALTGALGAFGVSLGGIGFLLPSLLRDFKGLNTLQKAYHTQVLKTGANSEKAKTKLKEFEHALGTVSPTTRKAFLSLDGLQTRWRRLSREARPQFFDMLGEGIDTLDHHFEWFHDNTLAAFGQLNKGWGEWMEGLRSDEAGRILKTLGRNGNESLLPLMRALGNIAAGMGRVAESFSNHLPGLVRGFRDWTEGFDDATKDTERLDDTTSDLLRSMRAVGGLLMATARVITAFFAPGVDDGTDMIERWTDGLNGLAREMRGAKREGINDWFRNSIALAEQFWGAIKPLAQIFFEWTTIMRPFTEVALEVVHTLGEIVQTILDFKPMRSILVTAFGIFLYGSLVKRVAGVASSLWSAAKAIATIKAAGGIGAAIKGGLLRFATGGLAGRGQTPANPLYVFSVNGGGGGPGAPVGGGKPGAGGLLARAAPWLMRAGGVAAVAGGVVALTKALDSIAKRKGLSQLDKDIAELVRNRDMSGLRNLRREFTDFGGNADDFTPKIDKAIDVLDKLNNRNLNKLQRNMGGNWRELRNDTKVTAERIDNLVDYHFRLIAQNVGKKTQQAKEAASKNFWQARREIKKAIERGAIDTDVGLRKIEQLWVKTMAMYGFSKKQAKNMAEGQQYTGAREEGQSGINKARGGLVQIGRKGARGRDSVPMNLGGVPSIVAPGEQIAVFNNHQQSKFAGAYPGGLEGFFAGPQRRHGFAGGGIVPVPGFPGERANASILDEIAGVVRRWPSLILTDAFGPGHDSPGHTVTGTAADFSGPDGAMDAAVRSLVAAGYKVGYDGRFGSERWPGHGPSWVTPNYHFHVEFGTNGGANIGAMAEDIKRVTIPQTEGLASVTGQAVVDLAREGANRSIAKALESSLAIPMGGGQGAGGTAATRAQMIQWATQALRQTGIFPATMSNVAKILELAMKESSWIVRSINNWDANAKGGNPSGGLMHITLDKVGGSYERLFNPVDNIATSIRYQSSRYGRLVTFSPYEQGGMVNMSESEWARGGMIEKPTLMTGEDGRSMPEYVVGTNPNFYSSNLDALKAAAEALGVPMARKSKKDKKKKQVRKGHGPDKIKAVQRYEDLQQEEEDKNREISIATLRVKEPDDFIKEIGKDPETGDSIYAVDQDAVNTYTTQMTTVKDLYNDLIRKIVRPMVETVGPKAVKRLGEYAGARTKNIGDIETAIAKDRKLLKSKDEDVRNKAQKRIDKNKNRLDQEKEWRRNARDTRTDIRDDMHDAGYRLQEYQIERDSLKEDISAIQPGAEEAVVEANPPAPGTEGAVSEPTGPTQVAAADTERANVLREFGGNVGMAVQTGVYDAMGGGGGLQLNVGGVNGLSAALGTAMTTAMMDVMTPVMSSAAAGSALSAPVGSGGAAAVGDGASVDNSKNVNIVNNNTFLEPAPDPHTYVKGLEFEAAAVV